MAAMYYITALTVGELELWRRHTMDMENMA